MEFENKANYATVNLSFAKHLADTVSFINLDKHDKIAYNGARRIGC